MRTDWLVTIPPREMTATSVVPPPMSTTMFPVGSCTGSPAPIAAAIGSSMMYAFRAPAYSAASMTARLLDSGDPRRDADDHPGLCEPALVDPLDEVAEHLLADLEVRDHPVFERTYRLDVARRPADHPLRLCTDCERPAVFDVHGHDGRLVQDDPASTHVDEGVRGAEVDGHIATEQEEAVVPHGLDPFR